MNIIIWAGFS